MFVWRIWTPRVTAKGQVYLNFDCDFGSLRDINDRLSAGKFLLGDVLHTKPGEDSQGKFWQVIGRRPTSIGPLGITTVEPFEARLIENGFTLENGRHL